MSRRWLVSEVIQTSAMDCGPACLTALLAGHGVRVSYGRLRDACQTDVDGTSIDAMEDAAVQLGLAAEQILVPVDHVLLAEAKALPAIAVTRQPDGSNHFVVLWGRLRGLVQVMDPAFGRRWVPARRLVSDLYVHQMELSADTWREWAGSDDLRRPLAQRLAALGISEPASMIDGALADPSWRSIAALDAATRTVQRLVDSGGLRAGAGSASIVRALASDPAVIPDDEWSARATDDPARLSVRGTVLVRVSGYTTTRPTSEALRAALDEPALRPWIHLYTTIAAGGRAAPLAIAVATATAVLLFVVEAMLWRALFETPELTTPQIGAAIATLVAFLALELLVEASLVGALYRLGRRVELGLRVKFLASIGRLGLRYLGSRPISDMVERSHALYRLRELPWLGAQLLRLALTLLVTASALIWLAPEAAWVALALAAATIAPPLLAHRALAERELRVRTHHGAISRFYFDALRGAAPARAHGLERVLRREHESRLAEWARAARREHALATATAAAQAILVTGLAVALVGAHVSVTDRPASVLLLVYWTVGMTTSGALFAEIVRELPVYRNLTLRLLEPLGAKSDAELAVGADRAPSAACAIALSEVAVVAGGHTILDGIDLSIAAGEHVAIVGPSGAGKSALLGLLLGWHHPARGKIEVGGAPLDASVIAALRRRMAWVDPAVQLWNDSLAGNLAFGAGCAVDLGATVVAAGLDGVLARLPEGMQTRLGEGGALVSGGEGQRVRFGRALARREVALVVLDEPFRGIERARRRALLAAARAHWRGATLLCATHDLAETRDFDRVLVIEGGRITEDGVPTELMARAGSRYAALLAEETVASGLWSRWRRLRLRNGRIEEVR
jgi:ATP-binding cassette subfamily B protein